MDGIHDIGGMDGFGRVEVELNEPVFHEPWERRVFGLNAVGIVVLRVYNVDEYRHAIERMDGGYYLAASYYERVLTGVATLLVEKGVVTHDELQARAGGAFPLSRSAVAPRSADAAQHVGPHFAVGDEVVIRTMHPVGHTRVPRYVRGKRGVIVHVTPPFSFPDAAAHGLPPRSEPTYHVRFDARELWAEAAEHNASVVVDLWESYLTAP